MKILTLAIMLALSTAACFALPNYRVGITSSYNSFFGSVHFYFNTTNTGTAAASQSITRYDVSLPGGMHDILNITVPPLPAGGYFDSESYGTEGCQPGDIYSVTAIADADNAINESNESDNNASLSYMVAPELPDLVISSFSAPSLMMLGRSYPASVTVSNIGTAASVEAAGSIGVGASSMRYPIPALMPGESVQIGGLTVSCFQAGALQSGASVDIFGQVEEANETNNAIFRTVHCMPIVARLNSTSAIATALALPPISAPAKYAEARAG